MKKIISLILALTVLLSLGALADNETVNVAALNGPTGMGMVKLMSDEEGKDAYAFTLAAGEFALKHTENSRVLLCLENGDTAEETLKAARFAGAAGWILW